MPNGKPKILLGIDPGLADTGYGVISADGQKITVITYGSIKTAKTLTLQERLKQIEQEIKAIIEKYQPEAAGIEKLFFQRNVTTAMLVSQVRGILMLILANNALPTLEFTPLQVKQSVTGYGQADKKQIQQMVKSICGLKEIPRPDDAADALAIAICLASCYKNPTYR
ncbi:MAG: crossover junction endodeoxyribonuclease RuvC [bacterium]